MTVKWINPFTLTDDVLHINRPNVDAFYWYNSINCKTDKDIVKVLDDVLTKLDCTKEYECGRPMMTTLFNYTNTMNDYYYYLLKLVNYIIYNTYLDKLIQRHIDNVLFEYEHPYVPKQVGKKRRNSKKRTIKNEFVRHKTFDLFTGKEKYIYNNDKTGEEIESSNPNLLKELNAKNKKTKPKREHIVPMKFMTFSFDKKK